MSLYDSQGNFTKGQDAVPTNSETELGGVPLSYRGFLEPNPSGDSPYQTGKLLTSPVIPYGQKSRGMIETGLLGVANAPTSLFRVAEALVNPMTYVNIGRTGAGGLQSVPGIKQFFDKVSTAKGKEILDTNREMFHGFIDTIRNQFGSVENIKRSIAEDPIGTGLIVRGLLEGASGITRKAGIEGTAGVLGKMGEAAFPIEKVFEKVLRVPGKLKIETGQTPEQIAGEITNAKPGQISKAVNALGQIDKTNLKTFSDYKTAFDEGIKTNLKTVDTKLETVPGTFKPEIITKEVQSGGKVIKTDYVQKMLDGLEEMYNKGVLPNDEARILDIKTKYQEEGLTAKEINNITREYGTEFSSRAFNKTTGEPLTSVSAQAFENIRSGGKDIVRSFLPNDAELISLDKTTGDMITTKKLIEKQETKVQQIENKLRKAGVLQKLGGKLFDAADIASGHVLKGLIRRILGKKGEGETMSALDIQNRLEKTGPLFDKLLAMKPEDAVKVLESGGTYKIPIVNLTPTERAINILKPKKVDVINLTPDEVEILRTIRYEY